MKYRLAVLMIATALCGVCATAQELGAQPSNGDRRKDEPQLRNVTGQVFTGSDQPLPSAVVYLKNTKTLAVKSFISENDGGFRFHALSPNIDYQIYAEYQGKKSSTKTLSAFDNRANVTMNLHIDVEKK